MRMLKLVQIPKKQIVQACYSAAMVRAIWETTQVENYNPGFWHFVGQSYFGIVPPVTVKVGSGDQLRDRRDQFFLRDILPTLQKMQHRAPNAMNKWLKELEIKKQTQLVDIRARFDLVKRTDERITDALLTSQRVCVVLERSAMIAEVLIPAGALFFAATAATIGGVGTVTALTACSMSVSLLHFVARQWSEVSVNHLTTFDDENHDKLGLKLTPAHHLSEAVAEVGEQQISAMEMIEKQIEKTLHHAGEELAHDPDFEAYIAKTKIQMQAGKFIKGAGIFGTVVCVIPEILEQIKAGGQDWNAGVRTAGAQH